MIDILNICLALSVSALIAALIWGVLEALPLGVLKWPAQLLWITIVVICCIQGFLRVDNRPPIIPIPPAPPSIIR